MVKYHMPLNSIFPIEEDVALHLRSITIITIIGPIEEKSNRFEFRLL